MWASKNGRLWRKNSLGFLGPGRIVIVPRACCENEEVGKNVLMVYRYAEEVAPYREAMEAAGLHPVLVRAGDPVSLDGMSGLLLMGGDDVDPALYGEERHPRTDPPDAELDRVEQALLRDALDRDLPVLGICRGLQLMNVFHGGTLIQHLDPPEQHRQKTDDKSVPAHAAKIEPGTLLADIAREPELRVNSRHHQAVKDLGAGLRIAAVEPVAGIVEALERPDKRFVLAVQWHPENQALSDPAQLRIFQRFGEAMVE